MMISRRRFLADGTLAVVGLTTFARSLRAQDLPPVAVYKSPTCGCCSKWADHMKSSGFPVVIHDMNDLTPIKTRYKVAPALRSCHTALVGGYVVEGHVPAGDVKKLLTTKPKVTGLTIPGMPRSAPGMDMTPFQPYDVLAFDDDGTTSVFAKHTK